MVGNEVNIAQRLAAESSSCRIYVTDAVRQAISDSFLAVKALGEMQLRGLENTTRSSALRKKKTSL